VSLKRHQKGEPFDPEATMAFDVLADQVVDELPGPDLTDTDLTKAQEADGRFAAMFDRAAADLAEEEEPTRRMVRAQRRDAERAARAAHEEAARRAKADHRAVAATRARELTAAAGRSFAAALRYEWARLRTLRSTWWLLLAAVAFNAAIAAAVAAGVNSGNQSLDPEGVVNLVTGGAGISPLCLTALFAGMVGVLALGHEYRHGLIGTTLTAVPRRGAVLAAKAVVVAGYAALTAGLAGLAAYGVGRVVIGPDWRFDLLRAGQTPRALGGFVVLVVLTALLGLALGGLLRSVPAALVVLLLLPLVVEPLVDALLQSESMAGAADAGRFMPFTAAYRMTAVSGGDNGHAFVPLDALGGGLVFAGYVLVAVGLTSVLLKARDA
jgi:ABC-2 type transport system permease protein